MIWKNYTHVATLKSQPVLCTRLCKHTYFYGSYLKYYMHIIKLHEWNVFLCVGARLFYLHFPSHANTHINIHVPS